MNKRLYQLDLLKVLATFMVLTLHILMHGALGKEMGVSQFLQSWGIEFFCLPAVNIYALITGYLCYQKSTTNKKIFNFYFKTVCYSVITFLIFSLLVSNAFTLKYFLDSTFIISRHSYWYTSSYIVTMLISPLLNAGIEKISKEGLRNILIIILIILCCLPFVTNRPVAYLNGGYNPLWLISLYLIGGYIGKYIEINKIKKSRFLLIIIIAISILFSLTIKYFGNYTEISYLKIMSSMLSNYNAPFIFMQALCMFLLFLTFEIKSKKIQEILKWLSDKAYFIYIVHNGPITGAALTGAIAYMFVNLNKTIIALDVILSVAILFVITLILFIIIEFFKKAFKKHKI